MAENEGKLWVGQLAVNDVQIGPAHPAGGDPDQDLPGPRLRIRDLSLDQRLARSLENHRAHARIFARIQLGKAESPRLREKAGPMLALPPEGRRESDRSPQQSSAVPLAGLLTREEVSR